MNRIDMKYIYIIVIFCISISAFGQSKKAFLEAASEAEINDNYYAALTYYNEALEFDRDDPDVLFRSAEAARQWNALTTAERKYSKLIDTLNAQDYPDARYYLAEVRQKLGKYEDAKIDYELYLSENEGEDEMLTAKAQKEIASVNWAISMQGKEDVGFKVEILGGDINSPYSDFGAIKVDEDIYYSSLRYEETDPEEKPSKLLSKILKAEGGTGAEMIDDEINMESKLVAHTAFNLDNSRLYYTLCEYISAADLRCDIYFRELNDDGTMGGAISIGTMVNDSSHTSTQPNIATDLTSGKETLYYVSDREGTKGNLDIWSAEIKSDGTAGAPVNIADINTAQNDITPYFHNSSKMLYFSSRGLMTLGGYDIFSSQQTSDGFSTPDNMGMPANSSFDDVYYTINVEENEAYFSSNRTGSQYVDSQQEACCFDIYRADIEEVELILNGLTFDKVTSRELLGATVTVLDANTGEEVGMKLNDLSNEHIIALRKNRDYIVIGAKESFYPDTIELSTRGITESDTIIRQLYLDSDLYRLDVTTFDLKTRAALAGATVTLVDVSGETPNVVSVNKLGNDFSFLLNPNKKYKILANKPEYQEATLFISTMAADNPDGKWIKKEMYLLKPELDTYLPLALYFDNDEPDKNSRSTTTDKVYSDLYNNYVVRKSVFKDEYGSANTDESFNSTDGEIDAFFDGEVVSGYSKLQTMLGVLVKELDLGQRVKISIRGYASPRFEPKYNLVLGQRRVASVKNEMLNFAGGVLRKYINSGQLQVIDVSFGEELAPDRVDDSISNKKLSIYSPEASKERRVEIISVTKNK